MRLLYISSHTYILSPNGEICSTGMMGNSYFEKYLHYFENITVLGQVCKETESNKMKKVGAPIKNSDQIHFCLVSRENGITSKLGPNKALKKLAETEARKADAVICKSASGVTLAKKCAKKNNIPFMIEVVGCPWDAMWNHSPVGKVLAPFMFLSLRNAVKDAPFVTYVTEHFLQKRYPTKGKSICVSDVELEETNICVLKDRIQRIEKSKPLMIIGTAGTVEVAYKGQEYVIRALANLKKKGNTGYQYHLAGGGNPSRLQELANSLGVEDQVFFEGPIPHDLMPKWLDSLDLYIQPSLTEGMPRALIEAMSRGVPAIGSSVGGIPELLGSDYTFPPKNEKAIEQLLILLKKHHLSEMAKNNFSNSQKFLPEALTSKRNEFFGLFVNAARRNEQ